MKNSLRQLNRVVPIRLSFLIPSGVMVNGKYEDTPVGTPQGGNLSPLLSNIMLNELDKELEKRGLRFVRYADDALIFVKSEKAANRVMSTIVRFIEEKLGLIVNVEKSRISRPKELKFLGFGYYYDTNNNNYKVKPHPSSVQKFQRKLRQLTKRNWNVPLAYRILKLNQESLKTMLFFYEHVQKDVAYMITWLHQTGSLSHNKWFKLAASPYEPTWYSDE